MTSRTCSFDGCERVTVARGLCDPHYRQSKAGKPLKPIKGLRPSGLNASGLVLWIEHNEVRKTERDCWEYTGRRMPNGYGMTTLFGKDVSVHRLFLTRYKGPPDEHLEARHHCDNKICCNPYHLDWGTTVENAIDCLERDRRTNVKLTTSQVREARRRCGRGESGSSVARDFGVAPSTINRILKGQRWTHVLGKGDA